MFVIRYWQRGRGQVSSGVSLVDKLKSRVCLTQTIRHVEISPSRCEAYSELERCCKQTANSQHQLDKCKQFGVSMCMRQCRYLGQIGTDVTQAQPPLQTPPAHPPPQCYNWH